MQEHCLIGSSLSLSPSLLYPFFSSLHGFAWPMTQMGPPERRDLSGISLLCRTETRKCPKIRMTTDSSSSRMGFSVLAMTLPRPRRRVVRSRLYGPIQPIRHLPRQPVACYRIRRTASGLWALWAAGCDRFCYPVRILGQGKKLGRQNARRGQYVLTSPVVVSPHFEFRQVSYS